MLPTRPWPAGAAWTAPSTGRQGPRSYTPPARRWAAAPRATPRPPPASAWPPAGSSTPWAPATATASTGRPSCWPGPTGAAWRWPTSWEPARSPSPPSPRGSTAIPGTRPPASPWPPSPRPPPRWSWSAWSPSTARRCWPTSGSCRAGATRATRAEPGPPARSGAPPRPSQGPLLLDEVDQHVVAQRLGGGEEGPAPVELGQPLDEGLQIAGGVEHEGVDADPLPGAAGHLGEGRLHRLGHGWVLEEHLAVAHDVGRRLAVGDHDDLLGPALAGQQPPAQHEGVLHVGAVDEVLRGQTHGRAPAAALQGVANGPLDVEVEGVAELVGLGLVGPLVTHAGGVGLVAPQAVLGQPGEEVRQGVLPYAAHPPRSQLVSPLPLLDDARLLQQLGQLGQPFQRTGRVVPHQLAGPVDVDVGQCAR